MKNSLPILYTILFFSCSSFNINELQIEEEPFIISAIITESELSSYANFKTYTIYQQSKKWDYLKQSIKNLDCEWKKSYASYISEMWIRQSSFSIQILKNGVVINDLPHQEQYSCECDVTQISNLINNE